MSATTTFSAQPTTAGVAGPVKQATVTLSTGGGGGGGGGGGAISCSGYAKTTVLPAFAYTIGRGQQTQITQGQGAGEIVVASFTTPATVGTPTVGVADNTPNTSGVRAKLSTTPCDVTNARFDYNSLSLGTSFQPNTTYYINILATDPIWVTLTPR